MIGKKVGMKAIVLLLLVAPFGLTHPGEEEKIYQHAAQPLHHRTPHISQCHKTFKVPSFVKRTVERRQTEFDRLRDKRGLDTDTVPLHERQASKLDEYINKDHQVKKPFTKESKPGQLFADDGACMMAPLVSEGPLCRAALLAMSHQFANFG